MTNRILFYVVVFITNIIQGITGFAGTMLAMPPSVMLVGFETAKPVLNFLGLLSGVYVVLLNRKSVNKMEFLKIVCVMSVSIAAGIALRSVFASHEKALYIALGVIVLVTALDGIFKNFIRPHFSNGARRDENSNSKKGQNPVVSLLLLVGAGITHGMFVCGGPLLVSYVTGKIEDKQEFRATLSACWIVLNGIIFADDLRTGLWTKELIGVAAISSVLLFAAMFVGSLLCKKMSRGLFMKVTYVLLIFSGIMLFVK